ncbi:hypothetical protein BCV71DRAFT_265697 [Rhizopus microsporus]|uniref:tRNA (guanosine(18)-2'-O)-methyltransferase TARBP1 n=1 Tax=Rhizopus microsporus TaxID=58291 RepID=A0A1X0RWI6_RHIZD|nr:hypothetical protein BCV71DRAFT_265697 [Rhizopus microsporus]
MDFTSVPFQELLVHNAEDKQLLNFLSHLDKQYTEAQDEKVRFGTLQILIPVYKAYLNRLQDIDEGNRVLETYLKPWILTSLSHESTVSTESVHLLENTVAFFIVKSFLTGYQFGKDTILMLLCQLVSIMTIEPDFVDLKPIEFIETCVDKLECSEQWQQVQQHKDNSIELECCLNILNYFIRDLNENEQLKTMGANDMDHWIELIFSIATAMIPCTDATISESKSIGVRQMLWQRTLQMYGLPATNLLRLEIYGLIARFFDFYFGLDEGKQTPDIRTDLRFEESFFMILQSGLRSNDSLARKYSAYILKRIIDFTEKYPSTIATKSESDWTRFFRWNVDKTKQYSDCWEDWFLLYDIMHESVIHLVDPVLHRFESLLNADNGMDPSWWTLIFYRGFQNETASVKRGLLEYIFSRENPQTLHIMGVEQGFMFGALFKTVDNTSLFQVPTQGALVSPFGEHFRAFIYRLVQALQTEHKVNFLRQLIHHFSHVVSSPAPILYAMEALAEVDRVSAWGPEELKSLRVLVDRHRNFNIPTTKKFLRKLGVAATVRFAHTATLSFSDIAKTVSSLVNEYPINASSQEFKMIRYWLENDVSANKSLDSIRQGLKDRIETYVCELKSEDIPETVLRSQANVLARASVFAVSTNEGHVDEEKLLDLLDAFLIHLTDSSMLLTLLESLWENFEATFDNQFNFTKTVHLDDDALLYILARIEGKYLNKEGPNVVDGDVVDLYLSLTKRILGKESVLELENKTEAIQTYYEKCIDLLKHRSSAVDPNKELSKPFHIQLLRILYQAATDLSYYSLDYDDQALSLVHGLPMKRTQEAIQQRSWGDVIASFIRYKWECIESIILYANAARKSNVTKECFDPVELYEVAIDQLESASEMCGEAIISSFGPLFAFPWEKNVELVSRCVDLAIELMKENINQSKTFPLLIKAFINVIFQPELLSVPELNEENGPIKKALHMVLDTGDLKPFIVAQASKHLHSYWSTFTEDACRSMQQYAPEFSKLAVFGPLRDREDQKLEAAISLKIATSEELEEAEGTAASVFNQNDYLVRVYMNDLLLRLDTNNERHREFANTLLASFLHILENDALYEYMYTNTVEHRLKLRVCCSTILIIDLVSEDKVDTCLETMFEIIRKETVTSVRCYLEWSIVRLLCRFPDRLPLYYQKLSDTSHKPNYVISLLTLSFTLGQCLPESCIEGYFDEIFVRLLPWLITNHFTIRLFAYCGWQHNWKACTKRGHGAMLENNRYLDSIGNFMETYVDCIKFFDKIQAQFYMARFDPIQDFNVEFIFRQMMTEFQVIDNEKIGSKAFVRVNPQRVERCPFENPERRSVYTAADPSELIGTEQPDAMATMDTPSNQSSEDVYQKKIMPWEMMLETDMDLTKNLVKKNRRRNDLIVVASLIDRLPNLAGLCRTCEIFNASLLVVPTLKIKEDIGFTSVSVASERWMPMTEVPESEVAKFLKEKREEGYTICGLEQTTTSATLGEYIFPEKCVLLLGKEKQGVPADLLQMLDVTIEIPQYGITRSLNVHVSGAICIYEYTKQMQWRQQAAINQS